MAAKLFTTAEARIDLDDAYAWYEHRRFGLGEDFLGCVDACLQAICRMPESYPVIYKSYRRALVRRFPYSVFYESADNTVTVYCIFHNSRDPQKWRTRLN